MKKILIVLFLISCGGETPLVSVSEPEGETEASEPDKLLPMPTEPLPFVETYEPVLETLDGGSRDVHPGCKKLNKHQKPHKRRCI